jgi:hypothetical protein
MNRSVSYSLSEDDLVAAYRRWHVRSWQTPKSLGQSALAFAIVWLLVIGANIMKSGYEGAIADATLFVGLLVLLMPAVFLFGHWYMGWYGRRFFRKTSLLQEPCTTGWSEEGLHFFSASCENKVGWSGFDSWAEDPVGFQFFLSKMQFYVLPRRAFSDEQWEDLRHILQHSGIKQIGNAGKAASPIQPKQSDDQPVQPRKPFVRWSGVGGVTLLWFILVLISAICAMLFPANWGGGLGEIFFRSAIPLIVGMIGALILRIRASAFWLTSVLLVLAIGAQMVVLAWSFFSTPRSAQSISQSLWMLSAAATAIIVSLRYSNRSWVRRGCAILALTAANIGLSTVARAEPYFWYATAEVRSLLQLKSPQEDTSNFDAMDRIMADQLWGVQPGLVTDAAKNFGPRIAGQSNFYGIAVAADGAQQIFSREGRAALKFAQAQFGKNYRGGILLSNGVDDLLQTPLATVDNLAAASDQFSGRTDPASDIAFIYLSSHGSPDAELATELPNYVRLSSISAEAVSKLLAKAGIRRRIIIVSACYSGSWIPMLADDDTIILTASAEDRTSFGCDDSRNLTLFGEALLKGKSAQKRSLKDTFEAARTTIARRENAWKITPSKPQAYVGKNMQDVWTRQFTE